MLAPSTLLIVEDDMGLATLYKQIFEIEGLRVHMASSLTEAKHILETHTLIDVCLTDIHIQGENALEMILAHKSSQKNRVEFILHSGDERYRESAHQHKMSFAGKPISIETLIRMVSDLIQQKRTA